MDYYELAIGAYKKWKSYICSTSKSNYIQRQMMVNFEKINNFSPDLIINKIKEYTDQLFNSDTSILMDELSKSNPVYIEPKITQIFSEDSRQIRIKKNFMLTCGIDIKYYIYDTMYTLIILKGLHDFNPKVLNNNDAYNNKISEELFDKNGLLNLENNSLFQKYSYNYNRWQEEVKKTINKHIKDKEKSFILSYIDFKNFYYNIPFDESMISSYFPGQLKKLFAVVNKMRDVFCEQSRQHIKDGFAIEGTYLPIGLISSMVLSELYMYKFDSIVSQIHNVSYYGRYCDDILFIYKDYRESFADSFDNVFTFNTKLSVEKIEIEGYTHLIPNEKSRSQANDESDLSIEDTESIFIAPSLIGECRKLSLKEQDLKEFIAGDEGIPDDPVSSILSDIYNYLLYGGDSTTFKKISLKLEEIIKDNDKLYLLCSQLEPCYCFFKNNDNNYNNIKKKIDSRLLEINYMDGVEDDKCVLKLEKMPDLNDYIKKVVLFYNKIAYERASAVSGEKNDWYNSFCYPIWMCDKSIDRYVNSYHEAQEKLKFYPFNIDISEIYFSNIIDFSCENIEDLYDKYNRLFKYYFNLNGFVSSVKYVDFEKDSAIPHISFNLADKPKDKSVFSAVANLDYDIQWDDRNVQTQKKDYQKTISIVVNTINEIKKINQYATVDFIVFPELYLNPLNFRKLAKVSKNLKISLIGGCKYQINNSIAKNQITNLVYFQIGTHNQCLPIIRLKNEYAPKEVEFLTKKGCDFASGKNIYYIVNDGVASYTSLYCYELTDIKVRSFIKDKINLLIASEYNQDTFYFANIIESVVRDISCYALQSNVSRFGDSRITAPMSQFKMNIASIKGGITDNVIVGKLKIRELEYFKNVQDFKNYVYSLDAITPTDKYEFGEYVNRLSEYYGFKNVSSDISHQKYTKKSKYIDMIELFIDKISDSKKIKKQLFSKEEDKDIDVNDYCEKK